MPSSPHEALREIFDGVEGVVLENGVATESAYFMHTRKEQHSKTAGCTIWQQAGGMFDTHGLVS